MNDAQHRGFKIGIFPDMPESEYHDDPCDGVPCLSKSIATKLINYSPAHAYLEHPLLGGERYESTKEMDDGEIMHAMMLGYAEEKLHVMRSLHQARGETEPSVVKNFKSNVAKEERDQARAAGKIPIFEHQTVRYTRAVRKVAQQMQAAGFPAEQGLVECSIFWVETASDGTPVQCKARLDHLRPGFNIIDDLKTASDARPGAKLGSHIYSFGYDIQDAAYRRAVEAVKPEMVGRVDFKFWFFEIADPCPVVPVELDGHFRMIGEARWRQAVDTWAYCLNTDTWPGYVAPGVTVRQGPPRWAEDDFEEKEEGSEV